MLLSGCVLQLFQQELSSREIVVEAVRSSVDNTDSVVSIQTEALNNVWQDVNRLSQLRDSRLHEALSLVCVNFTTTTPVQYMLLVPVLYANVRLRVSYKFD